MLGPGVPTGACVDPALTAGPDATPAAAGAADSEHAAAIEYTLNDGVHVRARLDTGGGSVRVTFVDGAGDALPGSPVLLEEDFRRRIDGVTITGYSAVADAVAITAAERHDGLLRTFFADGAAGIRFFQYARASSWFDPGPGRHLVEASGRWHLDGGSPYHGRVTGLPSASAGMFDGPGTGAAFDPFAALERMADPADIPEDGVRDGSSFTLVHEFETIPFGAGTTLGVITWGYTISWGRTGGATSKPVIRPSMVGWRSPASPGPNVWP